MLVVVVMRGEITRLLCAAPMGKNSSLSSGRGVMGGWSAAGGPTPLGSCLLAEDKPSPSFPSGGAPNVGASELTPGLVPPTNSPLA